MKYIHFNCRKMYLMPCPGPQVILVTPRLVTPCPIEMQSSPVPITLFDTLTRSDKLICMPSVLGLLDGAVIVRSKALKFWHI